MFEWKVYKKGSYYRLKRQTWYGWQWFRTYHAIWDTRSEDDAHAQCRTENGKSRDDKGYSNDKWAPAVLKTEIKVAHTKTGCKHLAEMLKVLGENTANRAEHEFVERFIGQDPEPRPCNVCGSYWHSHHHL